MAETRFLAATGFLSWIQEASVLPPFHPTSVRLARGLRGLFFAAVLLPAAGCGFHNFWDTVTSRDLTWREKLWAKEDPLEIVQKSSDGAKRGRALATL